MSMDARTGQPVCRHLAVRGAAVAVVMKNVHLHHRADVVILVLQLMVCYIVILARVAPGVTASVMVSQYCSDYMGVGGACASFCAVMGCRPGWTPTPGRRSCVCAQGYYRNSSNDCVQCPDGGTTGGIGASSISACYIPANQSISDSTGTYVYTQNCFYK